MKKLSAPVRPVPHTRIEAAIHVIRGQRVMLDADLAALYGVSTGRLNEQVKRNPLRFPQGFAFRLTGEEASGLISQIATSNAGRGGRRKLPMVFTEHGAVMLAGVLNSDIAVQTSIEVVRAFIALRRLLESNVDLAQRLEALEKRYDSQFRTVFQAIRELMNLPAATPARIGFKSSKAEPPASGRFKGAARRP